MQIQPIRQNQNNQQNFGLNVIHEGNVSEVKAALNWVVASLSRPEQKALVGKMRQSAERVSIEFKDNFGGQAPQIYLRDSQGKPIILSKLREDARKNFSVLMSFLDRLPKSQPTTTPPRGLSIADQLKQEFGIFA